MVVIDLWVLRVGVDMKPRTCGRKRRQHAAVATTATAVVMAKAPSELLILMVMAEAVLVLKLFLKQLKWVYGLIAGT